jgi:predicted dehydrogenase
MNFLKRRNFLKTTGAVITSSVFLNNKSIIEGANPIRQSKKKYKAAIIGRTGKGDYGHGLDIVFNDLDNVEVVALADENPVGLKKAAELSGATRQYLNYYEMLEKEKPDIVSIAPRRPDCHMDMAIASIEAGAHIYVEKPFTCTVEEADKIIDTAEKNNRKVCVAHFMRLYQDMMYLKELLKEGFIGEVLEMRACGKEDNRVGGEDLIVLGVHHLDLMRFFFGDPQWCFASVMKDGKDISPEDVYIGSEVHSTREPFLVAGDTVRASFSFKNNIHGYWESILSEHGKTNRFTEGYPPENPGRWGFDIYGSQGIVSYRKSINTSVFYSPTFYTARKDLDWEKLPEPKNFVIPEYKKHPILDFIHAIETDTQPQTSGYDGRWSIEMVSSVYESQINNERIYFPLKSRKHPLESFRKM